MEPVHLGGSTSGHPRKLMFLVNEDASAFDLLTTATLAGMPRQLQTQVDRFVTYYNEVRPHRAKARKTPRSAFDSRDKARPIEREVTYTRELRVRHDRVDQHGSVTIRYKSSCKGTRSILLVAGRHVRIIDGEGLLLRDFELDPYRDYQPRNLG